MGIFSRLFGAPGEGPGPAWRTEGAARRANGEPALANLYDRAADAPDDARAAFDLGSELLSSGEADRAVPVLAHALSLLPFDAILRSELALAQAHAGLPHDALATLALHPCLADDPGALYWLGWCALSTGDLALAQRAALDLKEHRAAERVRRMLERALERAAMRGFDPDDSRHRYYAETGGLLLASEAPDAFAEAVRALRLPKDVTPADDDARPLAESLARATGGAVRPAPPAGRLAEGTLVARDAAALEAFVGRLGGAGEVLVYLPSHDVARGASLAPDVLGVLRGARPPRTTLSQFLAAYPSALPREHAAPYVPDLPREENPR